MTNNGHASTWVVGGGYVGLPFTTLLAHHGHHVTIVEIDEAKRALIADRISPIDEPRLPEMLAAGRSAGLIDVDNAVRSYDPEDLHVVFLCVGTPTGGGEFGHAADLTALKAAARAASNALGEADDVLLVIRSTVPPGTAAEVKALTGRTVVSNPEFLREGTAVDDLLNQTRVVLGGPGWATEIIRKTYYPNVACLRMSNESAELAKYASNVMLGVRLTVMNELADICEGLTEAKIGDVRAVLATDPRIGDSFLAPSAGAGGPCLSKDMAALAWAATREIASPDKEHLRLFSVPGTITMASRVNAERMKNYLYDRLVKHLGVPLQAATIGVWGLTFKPGTDDIRTSAATELVWRLARAGVKVRCHDPNKLARIHMLDDKVSVLGHLHELVEVCSTPESAAREVDALVIATDWPEYNLETLKAAANVMVGDLVIDGRGSFRDHEVRACGLIPAIIGEPFKGELA